MNFLKTTAVMITGKTPAHEAWARVAVRCFLEQDYPSEYRELLIINDGSYRLLNDDVPTDRDGRPLLREVALPSARRTLGELRNVGLDRAWGDYVIQWDDDDWHGPGRISLQAQRLMADPNRVCSFLQRQVRYSFQFNSAKVYTSVRIHGTIMHRRCDIRYADRRKSEDTFFMREYIRRYGRRAFVHIWKPWWECDRYYVRLHHGHGEHCWNVFHIMGISAVLPGVWRLSHGSTARLTAVLRDYYSYDVRPGTLPGRNGSSP